VCVKNNNLKIRRRKGEERQRVVLEWHLNEDALKTTQQHSTYGFEKMPYQLS
jgi:hypothetical protein